MWQCHARGSCQTSARRCHHHATILCVSHITGHTSNRGTTVRPTIHHTVPVKSVSSEHCHERPPVLKDHSLTSSTVQGIFMVTSYGNELVCIYVPSTACESEELRSWCNNMESCFECLNFTKCFALHCTVQYVKSSMRKPIFTVGESE